MAPAAERIITQYQLELPGLPLSDVFPRLIEERVENTSPYPPLVVPEMMEDQFSRNQAASFMGAIVTAEHVEVEPIGGAGIGSLHEAIGRAAEGDPEARKMVEANVGTDVIERSIKAGIVMEVDLEVNEHGKVMQHGQTMESVHRNYLRFSPREGPMRERSEPETRNFFRIENLNRQGLLEDNYLVVVSRAADNMTREAMIDAGFFVDTMSCAIQATSAQGDGLKTESAFIAGVSALGQTRHDSETVVKLGAALGANYEHKSAAEIIDTPLLISKSLMPNGVIDLVKLYDSCAGGTFFGEAKPVQDYNQYLADCAVREQSFAPRVDTIVAALVAESGQIHSPLAATQRLHELSERHMVIQAVEDTSINPAVFGAVAAAHIEQARLFEQAGDSEQAQVATAKAQTTAKSSSCPSSATKSAEENSEGGGSDNEENDEWVKMTCPFCKDKNQWGYKCSPNQHCSDCGARVRGGKVVSKGDGGAKNRSSEHSPITKAIKSEKARRARVENKERVTA